MAQSSGGVLKRPPAAAGGLRISDSQVFFTQGAVTLARAIGSGRVGQSFLFARDGFWFQAPVSWYAKPAQWAVSPGFKSADFTRAIEPACLQCHTTGVRAIAHTQNGYEDPPWTEDGVGCERCHGPGDAHVRTGDPSSIVHPAKLDAPRRDSICQQCHLTGAARVARRNRTPYRPGQLLSDSLAVFVWSDAANSPATVTSHAERLRHSRCSQSGALTCTTCHDAHSDTPVAAYRDRCQSCHVKQKPCAATAAARQARRDDCVACHMPKVSGLESSEHGVYTDHAIPRRPVTPGARDPLRQLIPFFANATDRDRALAYAVLAPTEPALRRPGFELLQRAFTADPDDVPVAAQLAQFHDRLNQPAAAEATYRQILQRDPHHIAANANLGTVLVQRGEVDAALAHWRRALAANPAQTGVRLNIAVALFQAQRPAEAIAEIKEALRWDPTSASASNMLKEFEKR